MRKPKILVVDNSVDVTGALKSITRTAYDLKDVFDFVFVLPEHTKGRAWVEENGVNAHELPLKEINKTITRLITYLPFLFRNAIQLKRIIKKEQVSLLHVNDIYNLLPVALRLVGCKIPYVCHIRFLPDRFPPWLFNFWLNRHLRYARKIIMVSESVRNQLAPHEKLTLIYDALPVEERYPDEVTHEQSQHTFLYLSNFIKGKGQDFALEAFSAVSNQLPEWKIRFVGGDMGLEKNRQFLQALQQRAYELNLSDKVEWEGFTKEVEQEYKRADIVLNFSESESFSLTCAEALFFGRPLIATDCGGPAEIIDHEKTGLIVPNRDVKGMAEAMKRLANDQTERNDLAWQGKESVRRKFGLENTAHRLMDIYNEIVNKP